MLLKVVSYLSILHLPTFMAIWGTMVHRCHAMVTYTRFIDLGCELIRLRKPFKLSLDAHLRQRHIMNLRVQRTDARAVLKENGNAHDCTCSTTLLSNQVRSVLPGL